VEGREISKVLQASGASSTGSTPQRSCLAAQREVRPLSAFFSTENAGLVQAVSRTYPLERLDSDTAILEELKLLQSFFLSLGRTEQKKKETRMIFRF
jgi:hypothetical protein